MTSRTVQQGMENQRERTLPPMRRGRFLTLLRMSYGMSPDEATGAPIYTGRVRLLHGPGKEACVVRGVARTAIGQITALELALRRALVIEGRHDIPEVRLERYDAHVARPNADAGASVIAEAAVRFDAWSRAYRVEHSDTVTALFCCIFDAYDEFLFERWMQHLELAGLTPMEVLGSPL